MKRRSLRVFAFGALLMVGGAVFGLALSAEENTPVVIGRVEKVYVEDAEHTAAARIDTGAGVSSVHAEILRITKTDEADRKETVVFRLLDGTKRTRVLTRDIVDWQNIKKKGAKGGFVLRPVVEMDFCIAGKRIQARVNLADRERFLYPVLVGRNTLKAGDFLIDPAKTFTHKPVCPGR